MTEAATTGLLTGDQVAATADAIAQWQLPSGMIPWVPGGHADPWNHVEAAMALASAGDLQAAERAYGWLQGLQHDDGSWHQYYTADGVEQDKFDANVIAYVATGIWHHYLLTNDAGFVDEMFPMVERAIDWVFALQQPRGEVLGPPQRWDAMVVCAADRIIVDLPLSPVCPGARRGRKDRPLRLARSNRPLRRCVAPTT